jgi:hypothetical protein
MAEGKMPRRKRSNRTIRDGGTRGKRRSRFGRPLLAVCMLLGVMGGLMVSSSAAHATVRTALINGDTVVPSSDQPTMSDEQIQAKADGYSVTVVSGSTWDAMTEAQFRAYDVLIVGDPNCNYIAPSVTSNVSTWTKAVMDSGGNRFTIGSDPVLHSGTDSTSNRNHIIKDGISYAGLKAGATGAYVDTTCEATSNNTTILNDLSISGTGWSVESPACAGNIGIVASVPGFVTTDADLSDWYCSSHSDYPTWASDWVPVAISADAPTQNYCANDVETKLQVCGEPYILLAGTGVTITSNITLSPATATNPVGTNHTVTATVLKDGSPESGKTVTFTVSSGPNAGKTGSGVTDVNGKATFTYHDDGGRGTDAILAQFTDDSGRVQEASATKIWTPTTCGSQPKLDTIATGYHAYAAGSVSTSHVSTTGGGELLVALVQANGASTATQKVKSVTGAGLTWTRTAWADLTGAGSSEVWQAWAPTKLTNATVSASFAQPADGLLSVESFTGAAHQLGAVGIGSKVGGPAKATVTPTSSNSLVIAGGLDWSTATKPVPVAGQSLITWFVDHTVNDYYWTQSVAAPTTAGTPVTVKAGLPANDRWSLVAAEVPPAC